MRRSIGDGNDALERIVLRGCTPSIGLVICLSRQGMCSMPMPAVSRRRTCLSGQHFPPVQICRIPLSKGFPSKCRASASMTFENCLAVKVALTVLTNLAETARSPFLLDIRWSNEKCQGAFGKYIEPGTDLRRKKTRIGPGRRYDGMHWTAGPFVLANDALGELKTHLFVPSDSVGQGIRDEEPAAYIPPDSQSHSM